MDNYFVTVQKAKKLLKTNLFRLEPIMLPVTKAVGMVLAEDILSPFDLPLFNNSAMDGFAVRFGRSKTRFTLVKGEIRTGVKPEIVLKEGEAVKIYTGGMLPKGTDAVVMIENVKVDGDALFVTGKTPKLGDNIRYRGEEIRRGKKVLKGGTLLTPAAVGFLSTMGFTQVKVHRKPRVHLIVTGDELTKPGEDLPEGKIYDSNTYSLSSALRIAHIDDLKVSYVGDSMEKVHRVFGEALRFADILVFTGGVSVGEHDYVRKLMFKEEVDTVFYKVKQKPGKPLYFGRKDRRLVFGLPGNPASVLVCYYEYLYPAILGLMGYKRIFLPERRMRLKRDIVKKTDRVWFLKGKILRDGVLPLDFQESHMLSSFAQADCLIVAPQGRKNIHKGRYVSIHLLPHYCEGTGF